MKRRKTKRYEIWREGFAFSSEERGTADFLGTEEGENFIDACMRFAIRKGTSFYLDHDGVPTDWGCRLFDNELDARKSFG